MAKKKKDAVKHMKTEVLSRTKLYGFELFMSTVGLLAIAFVVDYGIFSLFKHFSQDFKPYSGSDEVVLFLVAAMIVWLPVATFFYLRTRGELQAMPKHGESRVHKVLASVYMVINTVVAIGALFYAVYALLEIVIGTSSGSSDPVMQRIIPGVLMALWHGWMIFAFTKTRVASRRAFAASYATMTVVIIMLLFAVTIGGVRDRALDQQTESDLASIQMAIDDYYSQENKLPSSRNHVKTPGLNKSFGHYTYRKTGDRRYELCGDFLQDTTESHLGYGTGDNKYTAYQVWGEHTSGLHCYNVEVAYDDSSQPESMPENN